VSRRFDLVHLAFFLAEHVGHEVVVIDEYGCLHGSCGEEVKRPA
jgi:hypothetical protein